MPLTKDEFQMKKVEQTKLEEKEKGWRKEVTKEIIRILKENKGLHFTVLEMMERISQEKYLQKDWRRSWTPISEAMLASFLSFSSKVIHVERLGDTWYFSYKGSLHG